MTDVDEHRLARVAGWNAAALAGAVTGLAGVADRLTSWRARLDALGRALDGAECWSGPAAREAAAGLLEVSAVAAAVEAGFGRSLEDLRPVVRSAGSAAADARTALALARAAGVPLGGLPDDEAGAAGAAAALAREALDAAAATHRGAAAAGEALLALGVRDGAAPGDFGGLATLVAPVHAAVPSSPGPAEVARWWASLPAGAQHELVERRPATVGGLDGLPAWARDRANRLLLERELADPLLPEEHRAAARAVADVLAAEEAAGRPAQLQLLDLAGKRAAVAFGDLDTADAVALLVPGLGITPDDDLGRLAGDARDLAAAATVAAPGLAVTAVAWIGYRTPHDVGTVATRSAAARGGAVLTAVLDGLGAARAAAGAALPRTTVVAHSYGTVVVDEAADRPGRLAADAVVLLGSPGMEDDAAALEVPEVYDAAPPGDPVAQLGWFGTPTWWPPFGSEGLPADSGTGHSGYYDPDRPTLAAMGEVVAGRS
ncbi:alpha/beta hydrolase [Blastococcus sp. TF02A-30]|uniref:alpha/beta hydrolase n=1 Tax=Blastococcus sp. TF02A-30 TaxID=2250580 RepID=UPI001314E208|nr:alpha/beta hydrolase [Blastococcus sp. TF02A-30]